MPTFLQRLITTPRFKIACRKTLFVTALLVTGVACFYTFENWRWNRAWNKYQAEKEAAGEWPMARFEPIPESENFAMHPLLRPLTEFESTTNGVRWLDEEGVNRLKHVQTFNRVDTTIVRPLLGSWTHARPISMAGLQIYYRGGTNYPVALVGEDNLERYRQNESSRHQFKGHIANFAKSPQPQTPAQDVLTALSIYDDVLAEMSEALKRPRSAFIQDPPDLHTIVFRHLPILQAPGHAYRLRAVANIRARNLKNGMSDILDAYLLAAQIGREPFTISARVRASLQDYVHQTIWEALREQVFTAAQLMIIQQELHKAYLTDQLIVGINSDQYYWTTKYVTHYAPPKFGVHSLVPFGRRQAAALSTCQYSDDILAAAEENAPLNDERIGRDPREITQSYNRYVLGQPIVERPGTTVNWGGTSTWLPLWRANIHVDLAITACALERYRLKNGSFPERLELLVPEFLNEVPKDRIDGNALRYTRRKSGLFSLYSIGANELDESGQLPDAIEPVGKRGFSGDWVWTYESEHLSED